MQVQQITLDITKTRRFGSAGQRTRADRYEQRRKGGDNNGKSKRFGSITMEVTVHQRRVVGTRHRRQVHVWFLGNRSGSTHFGVVLETLVLVN
jgi:hypothetical protein